MKLQLQAKPQSKTIIIEEQPIHDLIIIGGGPAGLTAAIYALRSRLKTLLVEKMILGGQASTTSRVDNYPGFPNSISGLDLAQKISEQAIKLGLEVVYGNATQIKNNDNVKEVIVDGIIYPTRAVIIATGTDPAKLGIPGEEELRGRGVSYCATCDGPFYQNKNVMVVGGGNAAVEEALYLTRFANKVSIVHRRDKLRADKIVAEQALSHPKIYFFWHSIAEEIIGEKAVSQVVLKDIHSEKKLRVPADGIFIYIGSKPNTEFIKDLIKLDAKGFILTDDKMKTSLAGIFAAGDVRTKSLRQIVTATSDGAVAAEAARLYIES